MIGYIYCLRDIINNKIFYVGSTKRKNLQLRFEEHIKTSKNSLLPYYIYMKDIGIENVNIELLDQIETHKRKKILEYEGNWQEKYKDTILNIHIHETSFKKADRLLVREKKREIWISTLKK